MGVTCTPIHDDNGNMIHDRKFRIFPFVRKVAAKHKSKNRPPDTIETKPIESVTAQLLRK